MSDYKRLTDKEHRYKYCAKCTYRNCQYCDEEMYLDAKAFERLAELEDLIEQGTLVQLDENLIGEEVIGIHKCTDGRYYLDLDENIVIGFTSNGVVTWNNSHGFNDYFENGYYFSNTEKGKAEAEARLEELKRSCNND